MIRFWWLLFVVCGWNSTWAQSSADDFAAFEKRVYVSGSDTLRYRLLLPEGYDERKSYPLLLLLHGMGEWGDDNRKQLTHCGRMLLDPVLRERHPAIVIAPQTGIDKPWMAKEWTNTPQGTQWGFSADPPETRELHLVAELVVQTSERMPVDKRRIYVTGLSMGAMGTFDLVCRYPRLFAAAVPICGGIHPARLDASVRGVKFRIFHGDSDPIVPCEWSRQAYGQLKKVGARVEYIELKGVDHVSWYPAYNRDDFMEWIFKQKR